MSAESFIDLQKAFDILDHKLLAYSWFSFYLSNGNQLVTINGFNSKMENFEYRIPQGPVPSPVFDIHQKDLQNAIKFSQSFHFADDTCILSIQNKISKINDSLNKDLNELIFCLNTKKTALNVTNW